MDTLTLLIIAGAACLLWEWWRRKVLSQRVEDLTGTTEEIEGVVAEIQELQQQLSDAINQDDYHDAIHISERMLVLSDNHFGHDPEVILPLLTALSNFHHIANQPLKAMPYLQRSIALREQFPALYADQADALGQLADLHIMTAARREAQPLLRKEIQLRRQHIPPDKALLCAQMKILSLNLEEPAMAEPLRLDIMATASKLDKELLADLASGANTLLKDALHEGRLHDAWSAAEQAALLSAVAHGPKHDFTYICRGNLAEMLRRNHHLEEAEAQFLELIKEEEKRSNGAEGLRVTYNNLALLYDECGRAEEAAKLRESQMVLLQASEVSTAARFNALNNLAVSQSSKRDDATAVTTYAEALALSPEGDDIDPRVWADTLNNYAITLVNLKRLPEAGRIYRKVLERKKAGVDIPMLTVAGSFNGLGIVFEQLGKLAQAQDMFERALALKERHLSPDDSSLETAHHNLGSIYAQLGDTANATKMAQRVISSREKRLGKDHPETQTARSNLEMVTYQPQQPTSAKLKPTTREEIDVLLVKTTGGRLFRYATYDFGRARDESVSMVLVPETQALTLHRKLTLALPQDWRCFIGSTRWLGEEKHDGMAELVTFKTPSQFDCLNIARTDAVNHDLDTDDIIKVLQDYDQRFGIRIYSAETDSVGFTLLRMPEDLDAFAQELLDFCMDLEDTGLIKQMIAASGNRVELWWD
jgi:tetratricopeptide (TPR) repeat protein